MAESKDLKTINVKLMNPDKLMFDGEADKINITAYDGEITILPKHIPMIFKLADEGTLRIHETDSQVKEFNISGGYGEYKLGNNLAICAFKVSSKEENL